MNPQQGIFIIKRWGLEPSDAYLTDDQKHELEAMRQRIAQAYPDRRLPPLMMLTVKPFMLGSDMMLRTLEGEAIPASHARFRQHPLAQLMVAGPAMLFPPMMQDLTQDPDTLAQFPHGMVVLTPRVASGLSPVELAAVVGHEYGHSLLGHQARIASFDVSTPEGKLDRAMKNRVMKCEADHFVSRFLPDAIHAITRSFPVIIRSIKGLPDDAPIEEDEHMRHVAEPTHPTQKARRSIAEVPGISSLATESIRFSPSCEVLPPAVVPSAPASALQR